MHHARSDYSWGVTKASRVVIPKRRNRGGGRAVGAVEHGEESPDDRNVLASKGGDFSSRYTAPTHPATPAVPPIRNDSRPSMNHPRQEPS
jgi:hypothetical protein